MTTMKTNRINYNEPAIRAEIAKCLGLCYTISGITKCTQNDFNVLVSLVCDELEHSYNLLQPSEVRKALFEGAKGNYGDFFGINLKTVNGWLKSYLDSNDREVFLAARQVSDAQNAPKQLEQEKPLTEEEIRQNRLKMINESYELYLQGKAMDWYLRHVDEMLEGVGVRKKAKTLFAECKAKGQKTIFESIN